MPDRQDCQEAVPSPPSNSSLRSEPLASRRRTKRRDVPSLTTWRKQHVSCISLFGGPAEVCRNHKGAAPRAFTASMPRKAKSMVRSGGERWFQQQLSSEICKMHSEPISKCYKARVHRHLSNSKSVYLGFYAIFLLNTKSRSVEPL